MAVDTGAIGIGGLGADVARCLVDRHSITAVQRTVADGSQRCDGFGLDWCVHHSCSRSWDELIRDAGRRGLKGTEEPTKSARRRRRAK